MSGSPVTFGPTLSLLTDFGLTDPYVGVMHGVIYSRAPGAKIVDLTHAIPAQDVKRAAIVLADSWRYLPPRTIHVVVVDPGVGTDRRIIAARVEDHVMLAPDNGVLSAVFDSRPPAEVRHVCNPDLFMKSVSRTFHGRDKFAPAAGLMAAGLGWSDYGPTTDEWVTLDLPRPTVGVDGAVTGQVLYADRFGNLVTNVPGTMLPLMPSFEIAGRTIGGLVKAYADAEPGQPLAIVGSTGRLEICVNGGSAAERLGATAGSAVIAMRTIRPPGN